MELLNECTFTTYLSVRVDVMFSFKPCSYEEESRFRHFVCAFPMRYHRWFPEVQNIFYQGNKKKLVPSNQDLEKLESFFNCAATLMTDNLQRLCLDSLKDYNDLLVQPQVSLISVSIYKVKRVV